MPAVILTRTRNILGLYPAELVVLFFGGFALLLYKAYDRALLDPVRLYRERVESLLPCYGVGLLLCLLLLRLHMLRSIGWVRWRDTWLAFRHAYLRVGGVIRDLRLIHAICVGFVVFIYLKHLIPVVNPRLYDRPFLLMEQGWFGGKLLATHLFDLLGLGLAEALSEGYFLFYPYVALLIFIFVFQRNPILAHEFFTAFTLTWLIGILIIYAVPTWGPVFFHPALFDEYPATGVQAMQNRLWQAKLALDRNPDDLKYPFLISGFPSLHLAIAYLGTIYLRRLHWTLALLSGSFCFLTFVTTLYFGWHYLLDDVGAILLALLAAHLARRFLEPLIVIAR